MAEIVTLNGRVKAVRLPKGVPSTISQRGQGGNRFALNKAGRTAFCNSHGWNPADLTSRTKMGRLRAEEKGGGVIDRWPYRHEDNLYEVLAQFSEMGCQTAPGWQAIVSLPERKRIEPDGKCWCRLLGDGYGAISKSSCLIAPTVRSNLAARNLRLRTGGTMIRSFSHATTTGRSGTSIWQELNVPLRRGC